MAEPLAELLEGRAQRLVALEAAGRREARRVELAPDDLVAREAPQAAAARRGHGQRLPAVEVGEDKKPELVVEQLRRRTFDAIHRASRPGANFGLKLGAACLMESY